MTEDDRYVRSGKTGGKQYRVAKDDKIVVDHIEAEAGDSIVLDQVLMMVDGEKVSMGAPPSLVLLLAPPCCARHVARRSWSSAASAARISAVFAVTVRT